MLNNITPKKEWGAILRYRSRLIERALLDITEPRKREHDEAITKSISAKCTFESPIVSLVETAEKCCLELCRALEQQALNYPVSPRYVNLYHVHDPKSDHLDRRPQITAENLEEHFKLQGCFYRETADRIPVLLSRSHESLSVLLAKHVSLLAPELSRHKAAIQSLPRKVARDLILFFKTLAASDSSTVRDSSGLISDGLSRILDESDYEDYLAWEGLWRKAKPAGRHYPTHSTYLAAVISTLLNFGWAPSIPPRNILIHLTPLKIAVVGTPCSGKSAVCEAMALSHGLEVITLNRLYSTYLAEAENRQEASRCSLVWEMFVKHESSIRDAVDRQAFDDDSVTIELLVAYMQHRQLYVRGFVLDDIPSTILQSKLLRNSLDGFDCDNVTNSLQRTKSALMEDPLDTGLPELPRNLLDLVVFLEVEPVTSFMRLREREYYKAIEGESRVPEVQETPFSAELLAGVQRRFLQLYEHMVFSIGGEEEHYRTADIQHGLHEEYKKISKGFLLLSGHDPIIEGLAAVESALRPEVQARLNAIVQKPNINILDGLQPTLPLPTAVAPLTQNLAQSFPETLNSEAPTDESSLIAARVGFDLKTEITKSYAESRIKDLQEKLSQPDELPRFEEDLQVTETKPPQFVGTETGVTKEHESPVNDPTQKEAQRSALRKFVFGEDYENALAKGADESKKEKKPPPESKRPDTNSSKPSATAAKPSKGAPSAAPRRAKPEPKEVEVVEEEEPPHIKPPRPPRKSDLGNPVVRDYVNMFSKTQVTGARIPQVPYCSDASESELDDIELVGDIPAVDTGDESQNGGLNPEEIDSAYARMHGIVEKELTAEEALHGRKMEKAYLKEAAGVRYPYGYPVVRLQNAAISQRLIRVEDNLLRLLDTEFNKDREASLAATDQTADFGDNSYRKLLTELPEPEEARPPPAESPISLPQEKPLTPPPGLSVPKAQTAKSDASSRNAKLLPLPTVSQATPNIHFTAICQWLTDRWKTVEKNHTRSAQQVFRVVRQIQYSVLQYVETCKDQHDFLLVSHDIHFRSVLFRWQTQFNAVESPKRCRPQFKELLHAQASDFQKALLEDINANKSKDLAMHEEIMKNGWVEDRLTLLINHFVVLMQLEMDTYVDGLNILRDYVFAAEVKLFCPQITNVIVIPYVDIGNLADRESKRPSTAAATPTAPTPAPPPAEGKKGKEAKIQEVEKPQTKQELFRPVNQENISLGLVARKQVPDTIGPAEPALPPPSKKIGPSKSDRRSQADAVRKHSKTQAIPQLPPPPKENPEESALREIYERAKEAAVKVQEMEHELRKTRNSLMPPVDTGKKTPLNSQKTVATHHVNPSRELQLPDSKPSGLEKAIDEETTFLLTRLEAIFNYATIILTDLRKMIKALDAKILARVEENHRRESTSTAMLMEFIHAQIENEEPIRQALVFQESQFGLSMDLFPAYTLNDVAAEKPPLEKMSVYNEFMKICSGVDMVVYEDLQKALIFGVERSYGKELVDPKWMQFDSDDLTTMANQLIRPPPDNVPDGTNVYDVQIDWNNVAKMMGAPPELEPRKQLL